VSTDPSGAALADEELAALQEAVLGAVISGEPLAAGTPPLQLPDRAFLPAGEPLPLSRENLAPRLVASPAPGFRLLPAPPEAGGYLQFAPVAPVQRAGDATWIVLEVWLAPRDGEHAGHPLGGVQVGFRRDPAAGWRLAEAPRAFAT
jgi:hypothetical protein